MKITDTNINELDFGVIYLMRESGSHPEDGSELIANDWYVTATALDGSRWLRHVGTWGWDVDYDDEGYPCAYQLALIPRGEHEMEPRHDVNERDIESACSEIAARLQASTARALNPDVWVEAVPVYGSEAYQAGSWEERTAAEEREAERWG